jgi:hypothetical protein
MRPPRLAATLVAVAGLAAGCASSGSNANSGRTAAARLRSELVAHHLPPRWVACVPSRFRVQDLTAYRCNVNFGDPHVEAYCAVVVEGKAVYAEWRQPNQGRQNRLAAERDCLRRLSSRLG